MLRPSFKPTSHQQRSFGSSFLGSCLNAGGFRPLRTRSRSSPAYEHPRDLRAKITAAQPPPGPHPSRLARLRRGRRPAHVGVPVLQPRARCGHGARVAPRRHLPGGGGGGGALGALGAVGFRHRRFSLHLGTCRFQGLECRGFRDPPRRKVPHRNVPGLGQSLDGRAPHARVLRLRWGWRQLRFTGTPCCWWRCWWWCCCCWCCDYCCCDYCCCDSCRLPPAAAAAATAEHERRDGAGRVQ